MPDAVTHFAPNPFWQSCFLSLLVFPPAMSIYFPRGFLRCYSCCFFSQRQLSAGGSGRGRRRRWRRSGQQACSRRKCQEISARPPGEPKARQLQLVEGSQACRPLAEFLSDEKKETLLACVPAVNGCPAEQNGYIFRELRVLVANV